MKKGEFLFTVVSSRLSKDGEYVIVKGYDKDDNIVTAFTKDTDKDIPCSGSKAIANVSEYEGELRTWLA